MPSPMREPLMTNSPLAVQSNITESPSDAEDVRRLQLHLMLLKRLARLNEAREKIDPVVHPRRRQMVDKALYSTYLDCVEQGRRDDARMILRLDRSKPAGEPL